MKKRHSVRYSTLEGVVCDLLQVWFLCTHYHQSLGENGGREGERQRRRGKEGKKKKKREKEREREKKREKDRYM